MTSAIFPSFGLTITSFFCIIANLYGLSAGTSPAAFAVTGAVTMLLGTAARLRLLWPDNVARGGAVSLKIVHAVAIVSLYSTLRWL